MKPYFTNGQQTIYHGDCRDILPGLAPGSADLLLTDPPYGVRYVTAWRSRTDPLVAPIGGDESLDLVRESMPILDRILANDRHAYLFASASRIGEASAAVEDFWKVKNVLVWDKGDAGSVGDLDAGYSVTWEGIVYANKGRRSLRGPRPRAIYRFDWSGTRDPVHPTVKPVGVLQWLMAKSTDDGEMVLDPWMGSGTTLRAAMNLGRQAIGIEIEERYCEAAARRLSQLAFDLEAVS